jgi:hypothetical protein
MSDRAASLYVAAWAALCVVAIAVFARAPRSFAITRTAYFRFLAVPWKLLSFAVALAFFLLVAPYTGDPTWDRIDACFMSVLTFLGAPWAVGAIYRALRGRAPWTQGYVAACLWLFSASWSYDLYLLLRDGRYPPTWAHNLIASSVLYCSGGLLWNLADRPGRGVIFGFMEEGWPIAEAGRLGRVLAYGLIFMGLVAAMMLPFFWGSG